MTVDASRLLLRLSGRFSDAEASAGDGLVLRVALLSLLPLETRLEGIEVTNEGEVLVFFFFISPGASLVGGFGFRSALVVLSSCVFFFWGGGKVRRLRFVRAKT